MKLYRVYGFQNKSHMLNEHFKAGKDKNYAPKDVVLGTIEAENMKKALEIALLRFSKEIHGLLKLEEFSLPRVSRQKRMPKLYLPLD